MTVLWFSLAAVTAIIGFALILLDKRLYPGAAKAASNTGKVHVAPPRAAAWGVPEPAPSAQSPAELVQRATAASAVFEQQAQPPALAHVPPVPAPEPAPADPAALAAPADQAPPQLPAELPVPPGSTVHYESHVHNESHIHNYNAPVYNGPVYNGPVYIENAHVEEASLDAPARRKGFFDRLVKSERQKRQQWANERNFQYEAGDTALVHRWRRGVFAARQAKAARAIVRAETDIGVLEFFDVDDLVAIAALHTEHPSSVLLELRAGWAGPPVLSDVTRVGELGGYEVHASDVGAGQRFLWDPRLEGFIARLPQFVRVLWNEGPWVLAELPLDIPEADLDAAAVVVRELADLLRVLPPELDPEPVDREGFDPGAPQSQLSRRAGQG